MASPSVSDNPVLAAWEGAHGGAPAFDQFEPSTISSRRWRRRSRRSAPRSRRSPPTPRRRPSPTRWRRWRRPAALLTRATRLLQHLHLDDEHAGDARGADLGLAASWRRLRDEITQNGALFARIKAVYEARETSGLTAEQQRLAVRGLRPLRAPGRGALRRRQDEPRRRSTSSWPASTRASQPEHPRRRGRPGAGAGERGRPRGPDADQIDAAAAEARARGLARASGRSPTPARRWSRS